MSLAIYSSSSCLRILARRPPLSDCLIHSSTLKFFPKYGNKMVQVYKDPLYHFVYIALVLLFGQLGINPYLCFRVYVIAIINTRHYQFRTMLHNFVTFFLLIPNNYSSTQEICSYIWINSESFVLYSHKN